MAEDEPMRGLRTVGLRTGGLETGGLEINGVETSESLLTKDMPDMSPRDFTDRNSTQFLEAPPVLDGPTFLAPDSGPIHPFKISVVDAGTWSIETEGSSVTNDADLSQITITSLSSNQTDFGFVYIQCTIDGGVPDGTATVVVSNTELSEVARTDDDQTEANLLIAEVRQGAGADNDTLDISQTWFTSALLARTFDSGDLVWTFIAYPAHPDSLTAGT